MTPFNLAGVGDPVPFGTPGRSRIVVPTVCDAPLLAGANIKNIYLRISGVI
jgi:hypothetical protein